MYGLQGGWGRKREREEGREEIIEFEVVIYFESLYKE